MAGVTYDIQMDLADTVPCEFTWMEGEAGPAIDLTGVDARFEIDDRQGGTAIVLSTGNGGILPMSAAGVISIQPGHSLFRSLTVGQYRYRLILTYPNGDWVLMAGKLVLA